MDTPSPAIRLLDTHPQGDPTAPPAKPHPDPVV